MQLYKVTIAAADAAAAEQAADGLAGLQPPPLATTLFEETGGGYRIEAYLVSQPAADALASALAGCGTRVGSPQVHAIPDTNWVAVSQAALPPVLAGPFIVHGSHDRARFFMRRRAIEIEAGEAFGTGHNATTTLCLRALDRVSRRGTFRRVIDLGCGTGVLAFAAARTFPAARVIATDNDPVAVAIAAGNARLNRLGNRVRVIEASGLDHPLLRGTGTADLVLANILPGPLIALAPRLRRLIAPGGVVVLCGLLTHQVREVVAVYRMAGFRLLRREEDEGWAAATVVRI